LRTRSRLSLTLIRSLPLDSRPEPLRHPDDAPDQRKLLCRRYRDCLSHAVSMFWESFGCGSCDVDESLTRDEQKRDLDGLAGFLRALQLR
jgi:hypothetical protein